MRLRGAKVYPGKRESRNLLSARAIAVAGEEDKDVPNCTDTRAMDALRKSILRVNFLLVQQSLFLKNFTSICRKRALRICVL